MYFLWGKKGITPLSKSTILSILLLFTKRSYQTIQAKIGTILKPQHQDLNETELEALTVLHFHPKFPNCWFDLCGIDPCSLWKAWWLFPLQQHAQKWRAGRFLGSPNLPPQVVASSWCLQGSWHRWNSACAGTQPLCKASPSINTLQSRNGGVWIT